MIEITYQMILSTIQTIALIVGIVYYLTIMRNQQKTRELTLKSQEQTLETRQTQLFMQIYQQINTEEWWTKWAELINLDVPDYETFLVEFDHSINPSSFGKRGHVWYTYNVIGHLLQDGKMEVVNAWRLVGIMAVLQWEKWRDIILELRVKQSLPYYFSGFEYLYSELIRFRSEHPELATY
jgi:hypothetical protein